MNAGNSNAAAKRRGPGRPFKPGQSGNPFGRPRVAAEVKALARQYGPEAVAKLVTLMRSSEDERVQLSAARELLNRGYGRVPFSVEHSGAPLVAVNVNAQPAPGSLTPEMAYKLMIEGAIEPDPAHPALTLQVPSSASPDPALLTKEETEEDSNT